VTEEAVSSDSEHDEDCTVCCDSNASVSQVHVWSRPHHTWNSGGVCTFTGDVIEFFLQKSPHVNKDFTSVVDFSPLLHGNDQLLVAETNKYCVWYVLLSITIQMGHNVRNDIV